MEPSLIHRKAKDYRWDGVELLPYKEDGRALFKSVTRQVLFSDPAQQSELRYFEVAPGGFSTLERHEHTHNALVLRGGGLRGVAADVPRPPPNDPAPVPPMTWHQFRATGGQPLGFLCMVNTTRDKPQLPSAEDMAALERDPKVAAFLRGGGA